jgi:glycosyltransferase involved in cell wall biosynthesis
VFEEKVRSRVPDAELWMVAEDCPPAPGVKVLGRVDNGALPRLYRQAWLFCLPSSYEGFGIPYIEAMASGCPVVASPNVGAREVTENGRYGKVVADDQLGEALVYLLQDADERTRLAAAGLARASDFNLSVIAERYEQTYRGIIDRSIDGL